MEDRKRKAVLKKPEKVVPVMVWAAAGALILAIVLFAHALPDAKTDEAIAFFNVKRLDRFHSQPSPPAPRVIVLGTSLSMCALFFDEDMGRFARENGLPGVDFIRFIKLDASLGDFAPLLDDIIRAKPDIVLLESNLFTLSGPADSREAWRTRFLGADAAQDDRKKLRAFVAGLFSKKSAPRQQDNPNVVMSEQRVLSILRQRQRQDDFERFRDAANERLALRPFSAPPQYERFFAAAMRKRIPVVLLDFPRPQKLDAVLPPEIRLAVQELTARYQRAFGLLRLEYPGMLDLGYFKDFTHLNEEGRIVFSRWFLSRLPVLIKQGSSS